MITVDYKGEGVVTNQKKIDDVMCERSLVYTQLTFEQRKTVKTVSDQQPIIPQFDFATILSIADDLL